WKDKAARNAQQGANKCEVKSSPRDMRVINDATYSEKVLLLSNPKMWAEVIQVWKSLTVNFRYRVGATTKKAKIESYTLLIWYNSYRIRCGVVYCPKNQFNCFYVCQYCPSGDHEMQLATLYKTGPQYADCPGHCKRALHRCPYEDTFVNCKNLKSLFGCNHPVVREKCPATCKCTTQIM
ncbi:Cysteine-rich venom protein DIS2, partial [Colius striatus]